MRKALFGPALLLAFCPTGYAAPSVYGELHLSTDYVPTDDQVEMALADNASHFGIQGSEKANIGMDIHYRLETAIDVSGETTEMKLRNRYLALESGMGTFYGGAFDTPFKKLGAMVELMPNTLGDRRSILGKKSGSSDKHLDVRAKNAIMYVTPVMDKYQMSFLASSGNDSDQYSDNTVMYSWSTVHRSNGLYLGYALEERFDLEVTGQRAVLGFDNQGNGLHFIFEKLDASAQFEQGFERNGWGVGLSYKSFDTTLKIQHMAATNYYKTSESSASVSSVAVYQTFSANFDLYLLSAYIKNDANADFGFTATERSDYYGGYKGKTGYALSMGATYRFGKSEP